MNITIRAYESGDAEEAVKVWNQVVEEGVAFPQEELLTAASGDAFFKSQTYAAVALDDATGEIAGLYILHPNNVGRCGHICNASYAVKRSVRGQHIGEKLVKDSLEKGREKGFRIMQFNAVVASNAGARHLYERLNFVELGTIPGGFRTASGGYEDIVLYYHLL